MLLVIKGHSLGKFKTKYRFLRMSKRSCLGVVAVSCVSIGVGLRPAESGVGVVTEMKSLEVKSC